MILTGSKFKLPILSQRALPSGGGPVLLVHYVVSARYPKLWGFKTMGPYPNNISSTMVASFCFLKMSNFSPSSDQFSTAFRPILLRIPWFDSKVMKATSGRTPPAGTSVYIHFFPFLTSIWIYYPFLRSIWKPCGLKVCIPGSIGKPDGCTSAKVNTLYIMSIL